MRLRVCAVAVGVLALAFAGATNAAAAQDVCSGGTIAPGTYNSLQITGICALPNGGAVTVNNGMTITSTGDLDGGKLGRLTVNGNITVNKGGTLLLGCDEDSQCGGVTNHRVTMSINAKDALAVILRHNTIGGNVNIVGGGGGVTCADHPQLGFPAYTDVEDNHIGQSVLVANVRSCWFGAFRNVTGGNMTIRDNVFALSDATEVSGNRVGQSLSCFRNSPAAQFGDSAGTPNFVGGHKFGECAAL